MMINWSFRKKMKTLYFGKAFLSYILCVLAWWIYELERQTDNDNEPDSDLQRLWARDSKDLGALKVFYFIHFISFHYLLISKNKQMLYTLYSTNKEMGWAGVTSYGEYFHQICDLPRGFHRLYTYIIVTCGYLYHRRV